MALKLVTVPTTEPLSLTEAKLHLRVTAADEDDLITALITVAREWCEHYQNRAYLTQTWDLTLDAWPSKPRATWIEIPLPPLQSVTSLTYLDSAGVSATMAAADYIVDTASEPGRLALGYGENWPTVTLRPVAAITVRFVAGHLASGLVPASVKQAMKLLIGHWFENREAILTGSISEQLELTVSALLGHGRILYA